LLILWGLTRGQEDDDLHTDIFVAVHFEAAQLVCKVKHFLDPFVDAHLPGGGEANAFVMRDPNDARGVFGAVAAGKDQQLAPGVDQERDLIINLKKKKVIS